MDLIRIVGSTEAPLVQVARVPVVGEFIAMDGLARRVTRVEHIPSTPLAWPWILSGPVTIAWNPPGPVAVVTVADNE